MAASDMRRSGKTKGREAVGEIVSVRFQPALPYLPAYFNPLGSRYGAFPGAAGCRCEEQTGNSLFDQIYVSAPFQTANGSFYPVGRCRPHPGLVRYARSRVRARRGCIGERKIFLMPEITLSPFNDRRPLLPGGGLRAEAAADRFRGRAAP